MATTVVHDATTRYDLHPLGDPIDCSFAAYIITVESSLKHPAVQLIARASREVLLQAESSA